MLQACTSPIRSTQTNSPEDVAQNVRENIDTLKPGGGYVFNNVHNIQAGVPPENIVALCDVDAAQRAAGVAEVKKYYDCAAVSEKFTGCAEHGDFRELLANDEIQAVLVATPDHWHVPVAVAAVKAGKDVYCEKPLTLTIDEGNLICQVAKETGRVVQVGTQQRSVGDDVEREGDPPDARRQQRRALGLPLAGPARRAGCARRWLPRATDRCARRSPPRCRRSNSGKRRGRPMSRTHLMAGILSDSTSASRTVTGPRQS